MAKSVAKIRVKPGAAAAFQRAVSELAVIARKETGCVFYELYQMKNAPEVFFFVEDKNAFVYMILYGVLHILIGYAFVGMF